MQMIFQDPYASLDPRMTVSEIIAEPIYINKTITDRHEIQKKVKTLMDTVGLDARLTNAYPHELDGGRRQRIGIAKALSVDPEFIVCDEPVSALDVSIQAQILNLMLDLQEEFGLTYMFVTHDLSVVKMISNEIAVMYLGKCVERAPSQELFQHPKHPYTKALLSAIPIPDLRFRGKKRELLKGEVASPINPAPGCRFAPRCPYCTAECREEGLEMEQAGPQHMVACRRWSELEEAMGSYLIRCGRLFDGVEKMLRERMEIRVEGTQITAVGQGLVPKEQEQVIDLSNATVTPGLIDAHVHLSTFDWKRREYEMLYCSKAWKGMAVLYHAERALRRGFTTLRFMGCNCDDGYASWMPNV